MKEHVQDYGVRKWAGDDLIELQAEPLSALQALVAPYAPCILTGCELETIPDGDGDYRLHAGYVALKGRKTVDNGAGTDTDTGAEGTENGADAGVAAATAENGETTAEEEYVKIVRVSAQTVKQPTVFLTLACTPISRAYGNGENKAIAYDYTAEVCDVLSKVGDRPYLTLVADAENPRLPDTLGITKKLDREDGEAQDTVVKFTETFTETDSVPNRPELKSGSRLGLLMRQIRKWFDELKDLKALAFKNKVAKGDLTEELAGELNGKAPSVHSHDEATSASNGFMSKRDKEKLDDIEPNANNYTHPSHTAISTITQGMTPSFGGTVYTYMYSVDDKGHVTGRTQRNVTIPSTRASASTAGLVVVDSALSSSSTNPVQNKAVYSALSGKSNSGHSHSWDNITDKPSYFTPSSHSHDPIDIGAPKILAAGSISENGIVTMHYDLGMFTISRTGNGRYTMTKKGLTFVPAGAIVLANITGSDAYLSYNIKTVYYSDRFIVHVTSSTGTSTNLPINFMIISPS